MYYDIFIRFKKNENLIVFKREVKDEHLYIVIDSIKKMYLMNTMMCKYPDFEIVIK